MAKASDIQVTATPSILLVGDSGTKKTRFIGTCPKPFVFDFDKGMASLRDNPDVEYATFKDAPHQSKVVNPEKGIYKYGDAWPAFIKKLNEIGELMEKGTNPYETLGFDSVTTLSNICMNYVLRSDGKSGQAPQIQHWGQQMALLETVMDQLTSWDILKVVTAHIQRNTNDVTQVVEMLPLVTGKLAGKIGIYFDEVYFTEVKKSQQGRVFSLTTEGTSLQKQAKTRYGVKDGSETSWDAIKQHFEG